MLRHSPKLPLTTVHASKSHRGPGTEESPALVSKSPEVEVQFSQLEDPPRLMTQFWVRHSTPVVDSNHSKHQSIWGLWETDVVEVFVGIAPPPETEANIGKQRPQGYWEFQVSPLGQWFELKILEARKNFDRNIASGFKKSVTPTGTDSWEATLEIPLEIFKEVLPPATPKKDAMDPSSQDFAQSLIGGAFAILGPPAQRTYLALHLPKQEKPDFHLPAFFKPFF